jgi:hypothetical protein
MSVRTAGLALLAVAGIAAGYLGTGHQPVVLTMASLIAITVLAGSDRWLAITLLVWLTPFHGFIAMKYALGPMQTLWKEYILILALLPGLVQFLVTKERLPAHPALVATIVYIVWGGIESFKGQGLMSVFAGLRLSFIYVPLLFMAVVNPLEERRFNLLLTGLFIAGTVAALYGVFQFLAGAEQLTALGLPVHERLWARFPQVNGTLSGPEYLGFFMAALMLLYTPLVPLAPAGLRPLMVAGLVLMGLANLATFHRGAWFVTVLGMMYLLIRQRGRKFTYVAIAVGLTVTVFQIAPELLGNLLGERFRLTFGSQDVSYQDRKSLFFDVTLPAITASPLGEGIGTIGGAASSLGRLESARKEISITESGYLNTARQLGLPGLAIELTLHVLLLLASLRAVRAAATFRERQLMTAVSAVQIMFMIGGFSDYPGELLPVNLLYWLLSGITLRAAMRETRP